MGDAFNDPITLFITWTTYGSWLPGDSRGWTQTLKGRQEPQPMLEDWCQRRLKEDSVLLNVQQRRSVEAVIREHAAHRGWDLHAVSARSNHAHVAVTVVPSTGDQEYRVADSIKRVRDQFKANATRVLRRGSVAIQNPRVWTKGGDIQFLDSDEALEQVVKYITEAQDRMGRGR